MYRIIFKIICLACGETYLKSPTFFLSYTQNYQSVPENKRRPMTTTLPLVHLPYAVKNSLNDGARVQQPAWGYVGGSVMGTTAFKSSESSLHRFERYLESTAHQLLYLSVQANQLVYDKERFYAVFPLIIVYTYSLHILKKLFKLFGTVTVQFNYIIVSRFLCS